MEPDTFGLKYKEILKAEDEDLNDFLSLKKLAPYRRQELVEKDRKSLQKKGKIYQLREKLQSKKRSSKESQEEDKEVDQNQLDRIASYSMPTKKAKKQKHAHGH